MASMRKSTQEATQNRGKTQYTGRITRARAEANRPEVPVPTMPPSAMIRPERSQPCRTAKGNRRRLRSLSIEFDIHDPKATQLQLQNDASGDDGGRTSDTSLMSASQLPPKPVLRMPPHTSTSINTHNTMTLDDNGQSSDASMISMSIEPLIASHSVHTSYRVTGLESSDSESGEEEDGSSEPGYTDDDEPEPGQNVMSYELRYAGDSQEAGYYDDDELEYGEDADAYKLRLQGQAENNAGSSKAESAPGSDVDED
ncbi:hypothetical protein BD410DRAFT_803999 [Rickenella mellea]|uniref:Uncharacterized protein n=1 Tax=Rickenella mellea TaxID=50990 RepID=A0A4Y7Q390_9AGAM|nr:hypothetical protein BD410DRAFT_803999 [Rickenella mellea]